MTTQTMEKELVTLTLTKEKLNELLKGIAEVSEEKIEQQANLLGRNERLAIHSKSLMAYEGTSVHLNPEDVDAEAFREDADFSGDRKSFTRGMYVLETVLEHSSSIEEMRLNVKSLITHTKSIIEENKKSIELALRKSQKDLGAIQKGLSNAAPTNNDLDNIEIIEIDFNNPDHLKEVFDRYRELSLDWDSEDLSPSIISVMKKISVDEATKFATFAKEINSLIFADFPEKSSVKEVETHLQDRTKYGGDQLEWAYIAMCATPLLVRGQYKNADETLYGTVLYGAASPAKVGMILGSKNLAQCAAGKLNGIILDGLGVRFKSNRAKARILNSLGLIPASLTDGKVAFFGNSTLYTGDQSDFREYAKVAVRNLIERSMIRYANTLAFKNLDYETKKSIESSMAKFLNVCKSFKLIDNWNADESGFGEKNDMPYIKASVRFHKCSEYFDIILESREDDI